MVWAQVWSKKTHMYCLHSDRTITYYEFENDELYRLSDYRDVEAQKGKSDPLLLFISSSTDESFPTRCCIHAEACLERQRMWNCQSIQIDDKYDWAHLFQGSTKGTHSARKLRYVYILISAYLVGCIPIRHLSSCSQWWASFNSGWMVCRQERRPQKDWSFSRLPSKGEAGFRSHGSSCWRVKGAR